MQIKNIYILVVVLFLAGCSKPTQSQFSVPLVEKEIKVDAILNEYCWEQSVSVQNLISPWDKQSVDKTTFKAFVSENGFNFCFEVVDETVVFFPFEEELTVAKEDRVELFFSNDTSLNKYYCIEMAPDGNVLDYSAKSYREFNNEWDFESVEIEAQITKHGYIVEGRISLEELKNIGINEEFFLGIYRADFKSKESEDVTWYSWIKPDSEKPDFHIPSSFEKVHLTNN